MVSALKLTQVAFITLHYTHRADVFVYSGLQQVLAVEKSGTP